MNVRTSVALNGHKVLASKAPNCHMQETASPSFDAIKTTHVSLIVSSSVLRLRSCCHTLSMNDTSNYLQIAPTCKNVGIEARLKVVFLPAATRRKPSFNMAC